MLLSIARKGCPTVRALLICRAMSPIALRIRELRTRKGWSQAELARRAGVNSSVVNRAERGETDVTMSTLEKLAKALGVSPRNLIKP
jgi:transcriptional regulator with XRE-family HTH domain